MNVNFLIFLTHVISQKKTLDDLKNFDSNFLTLLFFEFSHKISHRIHTLID